MKNNLEMISKYFEENVLGKEYRDEYSLWSQSKEQNDKERKDNWSKDILNSACIDLDGATVRFLSKKEGNLFAGYLVVDVEGISVSFAKYDTLSRTSKGCQYHFRKFSKIKDTGVWFISKPIGSSIWNNPEHILSVSHVDSETYEGITTNLVNYFHNSYFKEVDRLIEELKKYTEKFKEQSALFLEGNQELKYGRMYDIVDSYDIKDTAENVKSARVRLGNLNVNWKDVI